MLRLLLLLFLLSSPASLAGGELPANNDAPPIGQLLVGASPTVNPLHWDCSQSAGQYTSNSTYKSNLAALSAGFVAEVKASSFASGHYGAAPDTVYGIVLCRGDYPASACADGLQAAFQDVTERGVVCQSYKDATIYYDQYMLRFSGDDFLSNFTNAPEWVAFNMNNVTGAGDAAARFAARVLEMMNATADYAATRSPNRYATAKAWFGEQGLDVVYGMAQCTPDLPPVECRSCLAGIISQVPTWFNGASGSRAGGRILGVRCNLRYEKDLFFQETKETIELHMPDGKGGMSKMDIILFIIAGFVVLVLCLILIRWIVLRIKDHELQKIIGELHRVVTTELGYRFSLYRFPTIRDATENFSPAKKLGRGGFGTVYRGNLPDGLEIAVKRLDGSSWQGSKEFVNEIKLIIKLRHANLVQLLGCCLQRREMMLVYEYMPNRSLDYVLSDRSRRESLSWSDRLRVIDGISEGLAYLHSSSDAERCIVHRDIKLSNILLDGRMNPKISDFGISRIYRLHGTEPVPTELVGTRGYMAPEYIRSQQLSVKYDVYSFGVLVLEIINGNSVHDAAFVNQSGRSDHLLTHAWHVWNRGSYNELVDPCLGRVYEEVELKRRIQIALLCVQENPGERPEMRVVTRMLSNNDAGLLPDPQPPAYLNVQLGNAQASASTNDTEFITAPAQPEP